MGQTIDGSALVRLTVEVPCSSWGGDCQLVQVFDQAAREARQSLQSILTERLPQARIVGEAEVTAVLAKTKR